MLIAHLAAACLAVASDGSAADHVLDLLPLAAPDGASFAGLVVESGVVSALAAGDRPLFVEATVAGGALDGRVGPVGALDGIDGIDARDGAALDPDGDGVETWWTVDGAGLVEVVRDHGGAPAVGARVELPPGDARLTHDGLVVVGDLAGDLVGALVAEPGAGPRFVALWAGPRRAVARVAGTPAACAVAPDGSAWLVTPDTTTPIALTEPARDLLVRPLAGGSIELVYRAASGALRRAELNRTVDGALTGIDLALAVEDDAIDLAKAWLVDADADGDADLVANEDGRVVVRRGWGTSGFLAPRAVLAGEARGVRVADGVALVALPHAIARLDAGASRVQDAPIDGTRSDSAVLFASDADLDGDTDLRVGGFVGVNDGSGAFVWTQDTQDDAIAVRFTGTPTWNLRLRDASGGEIAFDFGPDAVAITETTDGRVTSSATLPCARTAASRPSFGASASPSVLIETRPGVVRLLQRTSAGWTLGEARVAPSGAALADVDQDGDDDLVAIADGRLLVWFGPRHTAPDAGAFLQFGAGEAGTDGVVPLLGASGPVRLSDEPGRVHLVRAAPDRDLFVAVTPDPTLLDQRLFPATFVVDRTQLAWLQGRTDREGRWDFPLDFEPGLVGHTLFGQAFVLDEGALGGISASNKLAVTYGR